MSWAAGGWVQSTLGGRLRDNGADAVAVSQSAESAWEMGPPSQTADWQWPVHTLSGSHGSEDSTVSSLYSLYYILHSMRSLALRLGINYTPAKYRISRQYHYHHTDRQGQGKRDHDHHQGSALAH